MTTDSPEARVTLTDDERKLHELGYAQELARKMSGFSNFAVSEEDRAHAFASPGACVVSTFPVGFFLPEFDTAYGISSGTSFSAPHLTGIVALCIANGACAGLAPAEIAAKLRHDAEARTQGDPDFGVYGDPIDPEEGRFFGYLVSAEDY